MQPGRGLFCAVATLKGTTTMDQITAGQKLSSEDAALLSSAHLDLLKAQMSGETVLGSTAGAELVAAAHRHVAATWADQVEPVCRVLLSLVHAGRDLVIPLSDHQLITGLNGSGKGAGAGFVAAPAAARNEVSA